MKVAAPLLLRPFRSLPPTAIFPIRLLGALLALTLGSCGEAPTAARRPATIAPKAVVQPLRSYTWATAATGPGCLPRLQAMMGWYETQTERFRQADFVAGQPVLGYDPQDGPPPEPQGPFSVSEEIVDDYLAALRGSGYFSAHCVVVLQAKARAADRALERKQPPRDQMPNLADIPLFPRDFDDMMTQKGEFIFTTEQSGRVVTLNDGFTLRRFVFDAACKVDSVSFKDVPQTDTNRK